MNWLYKSYTLNIMSLLGWVLFAIFKDDFCSVIKNSNEEIGIFYAFLFIPFNLLFISLCFLGLIIEYISYKSNNKFAYNFPKPKKMHKIVYLLLFYFGLLIGNFPILWLIATNLLNIIS